MKLLCCELAKTLQQVNMPATFSMLQMPLVAVCCYAPCTISSHTGLQCSGNVNLTGVAERFVVEMLKHECLNNPKSSRLVSVQQTVCSMLVSTAYQHYICNCVPSGDEVTISYFGDLTDPAALPQYALREVWGFLCSCPRCRAKKNLPLEVHRMVDQFETGIDKYDYNGTKELLSLSVLKLPCFCRIIVP